MKTVKVLNSIIFFVLVSTNMSFAKTETLRTLPAINDGSQYCMDLLKEALNRSNKNFNIKAIDRNTSQARQIQDVIDGKLDVIWLATSKEIENILNPIRIPVFKGLLGHRIFIIRKGEQSRFSRISSIDDLKEKFKLGQGLTWADTEILKSNNLNVVTSVKYEGLFHMLDGSRFDAFPRGVHEPWAEVKNRPELPLEIEDELALVYKMPLYFFVSQENTSLAKQINTGLNEMIMDGSFDTFFYNHPTIKETLSKSNIASRRVFHLKNLELPHKTPINDHKLWLDITKIWQNY